jgi:hypothetical protein
MRLSWKDGGATLLVGAAVTLYFAYVMDAGLPLVSGPRVLSAVVFALGLAACVVGAQMPGMTADRKTDNWAGVFSMFGGLAFVAAAVTVVTGSGWPLAVLVATVVTMWALATTRHAVAHLRRPQATDARTHERIEESIQRR